MAFDTLNAQVPRCVLIGNGTRGPFTLQDTDGNHIRVRTQSHLVVKRYASTTDEDGTELVLNTDFTVDNTDVDDVTVTLTVAQDVLASSERLVVERLQSASDVIALAQGADFSGLVLAAAISVLTEQIQELRKDVDRKIGVDWRETGDVTVPIAPTSGQGIMVRETDGSISYINTADGEVVGSTTTVTSLDGEAARTLAERGRERMSILDFMEDAAERTAALAGTAGFFNDTAVQRAIDWAMEDEGNRDLLAPCGFRCSGDITNLHNVKIYGPGWIEIGTGGRWYFDANQLNTGFGALDFNTLYVDPQNGDDDNSGLAEEFAVATGQRALDILSVKGSPLEGYFQIELLEGVYTEEMTTYNVESAGDNPLYITGPDPASDWDNTDPPDQGFTINSITAASPPVVTVSGVEFITVTNGGSGYTSTPAIGFTGGAGSGAVAEALVESGVVTMIVVTTKGTGYTSAPTVTFTGGGGSGAAATARIGHNMNNGDKVFFGKVTKSGGAHQSDGAFYTVANKTDTTFELSGINGSAWSSVTGGYGWRIHKSRPKAVYYGDGTDFVGVRVTRNTKADVRNIFGVNCGSSVSTDNGAVVVFSEGSSGYARNIHAARSQMAVFIRESADVVYQIGGNAVDCWNGARVIHARYSVGSANTTTTLTTTPMFQRCFRPLEIWEGATGHADGIKYQNNSFLPFVWKNSQLTGHYCQHINTSATPARGYVVDGSYVEIDTDNSQNVWRGLWKPRVEYRSFVSANVTTETAYTPRNLDTTRITITPGGGEITVLTVPVSQQTFNFYPQSAKVMVRGTGTQANGNTILRVKKGSTTLYSRTVALNASAREMRWDVELVATGFDAVTIDFIERVLTGSTTTTAYDISSASFDMTSANDTLSVTLELASASDTFTVQHSALDTLGC